MAFGKDFLCIASALRADIRVPFVRAEVHVEMSRIPERFAGISLDVRVVFENFPGFSCPLSALQK